MNNIYNRSARLKNSPSKPMAEWVPQRCQPANSTPNSFRIFPIDHYNENILQLKSKALKSAKCSHQKHGQFDSYYSLADKISNFQSIGLSNRRANLRQGKHSGKYLSRTICNQNIFWWEPPKTPYMQRKIKRARNKLADEINRNISYSGEAQTIQIAHGVKLHSVEGSQQYNSSSANAGYDGRRSNQSKYRSKVHGIKYNEKLKGPLEGEGRKDNLRPWSGNVCGFGLLNQENYFPCSALK